MSLDGVIQAPGGPEEDTSGKFEYGGWTTTYADEASGQFMEKIMQPADLLLGRKTFDIFASYWPEHAEQWPGINEVSKYVLSKTMTASDWENSIFIKDIEGIKKLKKTEGSDLKTWGSSELVSLLLKHDLVDELWLTIYPVILGKGKGFFDAAAVPTAFTLKEHLVTPKGVIMTYYEKAGEIKTGTVGAS